MSQGYGRVTNIRVQQPLIAGRGRQITLAFTTHQRWADIEELEISFSVMISTLRITADNVMAKKPGCILTMLLGANFRIGDMFVHVN
jgi:hypothetical protein